MTSPSSSEPPAHLLQITTANHHNPTSSSSSSLAKSSSRSPRAGGGGGQNQACAACKYQRRKCNPDCPLARYFPAEHQRRFLNAHRLFGVSNIQKTLRDTDPEFQPDAMRALVFQAEARALDPVKGCWGIITDLEAQFHLLQLESAAVRHHLDLCRQQAAAVRHHLDQGMLLAAGPAHEQDDAIVHALYADQETAGQANGGAQDHFALDQAQPMPQQRFFYYDDEASSHAWSKVDNSAQQQYGNGSAGFKAGGSPVALGEQLEQNCQIEAPFVDVFNLKHEITTTMEDNGLENDLEEKVLTVVKNEVEGTQMAESSAAAHCQLELGFSSF